ncbi:hypothetical protein B0H10DRAFT_1842787 [Mycena sp. CBHHK59/15]|nr:hypothetical protein B0H10DRAFT_1842787 [Mycena sp. CBHHK59/15]
MPLVAFGQLVKHRANLKDQSAIVLDQFCENSSADERQVMLYARLLEVHDTLKRNEKADEWKITSALKVHLTPLFSTCFWNVPQIHYIQNGAMRELNLANLPSEKEVGQNELVTKSICKMLTSQRNVLKTKINSSMASDSPTRNIADLAAAVLAGGKTGMKPTLQLYQRLAFLVCPPFSYHSATLLTYFWLKVDSVIASYRKEAGTEVEISQLFTDIYADDKIRYGNPEDTGRVTERIEDADHWHKILAKHAQNVQPHAAKTLKRKFAEVEPVNEEGASPTE